MDEKVKYTFTFSKDAEPKFRSIMGRLDPDEFITHKEITIIEDAKYAHYDWKREAILEMEPDACLTFRLGMGDAIKIRRERTEEELAAEKALDDANTVKITVKVNGLPPVTP
jgi:hypothetical protein